MQNKIVKYDLTNQFDEFYNLEKDEIRGIMHEKNESLLYDSLPMQIISSDFNFQGRPGPRKFAGIPRLVQAQQQLRGTFRRGMEARVGGTRAWSLSNLSIANCLLMGVKRTQQACLLRSIREELLRFLKGSGLRSAIWLLSRWQQI